jgi:hypothetical protein
MVLKDLGVYKESRDKGLGVNKLLVIQGLGVLRSWYSIWSNQLR